MGTQKTHWKVEDNLNYIGAYSFQPDEIKTLTIKVVKREKIKNPKDKTHEEKTKNIIYFEEDVKPMISNQVNSEKLSELFGSNYIEDWSGKKIMLRVEQVYAFGKNNDAIRVVPKLPKQKKTLNSKKSTWESAVQSVLEGNVTVDRLLKQYKIPKKDIEYLQSIAGGENA